MRLIVATTTALAIAGTSAILLSARRAGPPTFPSEQAAIAYDTCLGKAAGIEGLRFETNSYGPLITKVYDDQRPRGDKYLAVIEPRENASDAFKATLYFKPPHSSVELGLTDPANQRLETIDIALEQTADAAPACRRSANGLKLG